MIYNPKQKDNRRFKPISLPTARKLFERYGYSLATDGHPDNTDPYKFKEPAFRSGVFPKDVVSGAMVKGISAAFADEPKDDPKDTPKDGPKDTNDEPKD